MKSKTLTYIAFTTAITALIAPRPLVAQDNPDVSGKQRNYTVTSLGLLGGTLSSAYGINNRGWVTGAANLEGDQNEHPFLWRDGVMSDVGTNGGPNGSAGFPLKNNRGLVVGFAQTSTPDPLAENWTLYCNLSETQPCEGSNLVMSGFAWQDGVKTLMPTLGGNHGYATGANNSGQVVGFAETANQDSTCVPPQVLDYEAVIWNPVEGKIRMLPPFPGDSIGAAIGINDRGQVVGTSGQCAPVSPAIAVHALLWQNGRVTNLGSLGGLTGNLAYAINNRTQVVGISDVAGDTTAHAFLWQNGKMIDLGTLPGDVFSVAFSINNRGQVVGESCDASGNCRAFLWQNGVMTDLNTLIPSSSPLYLLAAYDLNDQGAIVGQGFDPVSGDAPGFLAAPSSCDDAVESAATAERMQPRKIVLPDSIRLRMREKLHVGPFAAPPTGTSNPSSSSPADQQTLACAETRDVTVDTGTQNGYCRVSTTGKITGYCLARGHFPCLAAPSAICPTGASVLQKGWQACNLWRPLEIDLARPCSF
jgi:probable HAF family extracellular repeat protein